MKICLFRWAVAWAVLSATALAVPAHAARVGVLSNQYFAETAAGFNANVTGHTFTAVDVSATTPSLAALTASYDVLLLFEDGTFLNSGNVGNVVAAFANSGRPVVLGAFYDQDRTDSPPETVPHGWGALETMDPNTTDGVATPYVARSLNTETLVSHDLTAGLTALSSAKFAGGNDAKPGTIVVAAWTQPNARGKVDPAIAYRVTGDACVIHVAIAPQYPALGAAGIDYGGDFYRAWKNAFDFAANGCAAAGVGAAAAAIPAVSDWSLALTALLVAAIGFAQRRRLAQRSGPR
jgi:hypothetical protein